MISLNNIEVSFGAVTLLKNISFIINRTERIALTGKNGAGKSTLLKIISGLQTPSGGTVSRENDIKIGYLPQQMPISDSTTLAEEVRKSFSRQLSLHKELDTLMDRLGEQEDYESAEYQKLLDKIETLNHQLSIESVADMEAEMEQTLTGLGFVREDFDRPTSEFSGGWRMRIELAKILLSHPDLLLLDEPTNHLDIESIQWLENLMTQKKKTLLVVSHDRAFLDNVTTRTIEINCGNIHDYKVNFSQFVELRRERLEQQRRAYENQQKQIAEIKDFIERFRYKATKAVQVQSRIKQLEKIVPIEIDEVDTSHISLTFPPTKRSGDYPLIIEDLRKCYGSHCVFSDVTLTLKRGEKVAFAGKNGEGKSTLVKCIMDQVDYSGSLKVGQNVQIGYFAQNEAQLLDENLTVFETIDNVAVGDIRTKIKDILGAFLFRGDDIDKKVKVLSGGEKTRLAMIKLLLQPVNFLIMDEPTNHLDIATKEILKRALMKYDGTLILVSHDRDFLDGLVSKVYEFGGARVKEHLGGVYDFLAKKAITDFSALEKSPAKGIKKNEGPGDNPELQSSKASSRENYLQRKEQEKIRKKAEKAVVAAEQRIAELEKELTAIENKISEGDSSAPTLEKFSNCNDLLQKALEEWEEAQYNLESL